MKDVANWDYVTLSLLDLHLTCQSDAFIITHYMNLGYSTYMIYQSLNSHVTGLNSLN